RRQRSLRAAPLQQVRQAIAIGREAERYRIQAVTFAGRRRAVRKHVAEMAAAARADDFGANHAVTGIADFAHVPGIERREKARPTGARVELRARPEQRQPAQATRVDAVELVVEKRPAERRLGSVL